MSTLQTFFSAGVGRVAAENAADLHAAGVPLRYGTDLGNDGTRPGVDPRELDRLADAGMGRLGALRAATEFGARARPGSAAEPGGSKSARGRPWSCSQAIHWTSRECGDLRSAVVADGRLLVNAQPPDTLDG